MHSFLSGDPKEILAEKHSRAKAAEKRNQTCPENRPDRNREQEITHWNMRVLSVEGETMRGNYKERNTWITGQYHCSTSPIESLQSIQFREMMVPKLHTGRYLICRTLGKIFITVGTSAFVEDLNGDVEYLSLYNFRYDLNDTSWLPPGSIMVIKEPYLEYGSTGESTLIRVDSPSDVEFVEEADYNRLEYIGALKWYKKEKLNFDQLKAEGNTQFGKNNFEIALKYYNKALLLDPKAAVIHLNKAAALLPLERFYEAYNEATIALEADANAEKSLYRLGMAAYGMRQWDKGIKHFRELLDRSPDHKEAKAALQRTKTRINESHTGQYNIRDLYNKTVKGNLRRLDIADYIGPVKVVDVPGKGKGLVAIDNISKGTLIIASKAFSASFHEDLDGYVSLVNLPLNRIDETTRLLNMIKTNEHLQKNPQLASDLYSLSAEGMQRDHEIPAGVIDTARIQNICYNNCFDIQTATGIQIVKEEEDKTEKGNGLWILPAFINHSCLENASRTFYGDFLMIFAVQNIAKGEEITLAYINVFESYKKREEMLGYFGFQCDCRLCELDRADGDIVSERQRLLSECEKVFKSLEHIGNSSQQTVSRLISLTNQIRQTYKNRSEYRLDLYELLLMLGTLHNQKSSYRNGIKYFEEAVECLGESLRHTLGSKALIYLALYYLKLGEHQKAKEHMRQAVDIYKVKMGADKELFKELFPGLPESLY